MKTKSKVSQIRVEATGEIQTLLAKMLKSQESGLINEFAECFSHDENIVNIGTDMDEIWQGWFPFFKWMSKTIRKNTGIKISDRDTVINISPQGDTAWFFQLIDTCYETKGDTQRIEGFRHTGVIQKKDDQWKIVQSHISIPFKPE